MTNRPSTPPGIPVAGGVPAVLLDMRHQVSELAQTMWAARRGEELMDTVTEIESLKSSLEALELDVVSELEATRTVKPMGWASTQDFVTAVAGGHKGSGSAVVRLAKAVESALFAPVREALADGWLSVPKAQVVVRAVEHLPGHPEVRRRAVSVLLDEAKRLDASELRRSGRHLVARVDQDGEARREEQELDREERAAHLGRKFWMRFDGAGGCWFGGSGTVEDGEKLRTTLMSLAAPKPSNGPTCDPGSCDLPCCGHDGRDPRDHGARMFDALIELCDKAAQVSLLPECHGITPRVSVAIDFEALKQHTHGTTETGEEVSGEGVRRMACDAEIIPVVLGTIGEVLDVGRTQRLVTPAIWRALVARDRHCRFPNCTRPPVMGHAHHITHWADGGHTSLWNLILLCGHHHRLVHAGPWTIRRTSRNGFAFDPPPSTRRMRSIGREPPDG
jgi:hypothetical protein